jgi:MoaA/NifB/PqqE/SkfB family radical SAM enzyme
MLKTEDLMRMNRRVRSTRLKFFMIFLADLFDMRHTVVRFDPASGCNLRCRMCYFSNESWLAKQREMRFTWPEVERIASEFFPRALQVHIGCGREPTVYKGFEDIVALAKRHGVGFVSLVSNGQLLGRPQIEKLVDFGLDEITLSVHGVEARTYEHLMRGASHARLLEVLETLMEVRGERGALVPRLRLNYTVNRDNLDELARWYDVYGEFDVAVLQLRPMIDFGTETCANARLDGVLDEYRKVVEVLKRESAARGVTLLYNDADPTYRMENTFAPAYAIGSLRHVTPTSVWEAGYDWRNVGYRDYARRSGFRRRLLAYALGARQVPAHKTALGSSQVF